MGKNLKKILIASASLLMMASIGAELTSTKVSANDTVVRYEGPTEHIGNGNARDTWVYHGQKIHVDPSYTNDGYVSSHTMGWVSQSYLRPLHHVHHYRKNAKKHTRRPVRKAKRAKKAKKPARKLAKKNNKRAKRHMMAAKKYQARKAHRKTAVRTRRAARKVRHHSVRKNGYSQALKDEQLTPSTDNLINLRHVLNPSYVKGFIAYNKDPKNYGDSAKVVKTEIDSAKAFYKHGTLFKKGWLDSDNIGKIDKKLSSDPQYIQGWYSRDAINNTKDKSMIPSDYAFSMSNKLYTSQSDIAKRNTALNKINHDKAFFNPSDNN